MTQVGNAAHAALALNDGLPFLAEGSTRRVYLYDGVVYKVNLYTDYGDDNQAEYDNIMRGTDVPGVYFPATSLYMINGESVIAMEFIPGQPIAECLCFANEAHTSICMAPEILERVMQVIYDTSGTNVIVNERGIFIIDAAA